MQEQYIQTQQQLEQLCEDLADSSWLVLDTEFIREKSYYSKLCLLQISNGKLAAAVDVVSLKSWQPLIDLLYRKDILKIFHAAHQDLEIFQQLCGAPPAPLFDTQPAAALLGYGEQVGYGDLVQKELGITLEKGQSRTDWMRRPLSDKQIRYALDDVIYLCDVYHQLRGKLEERGRLDWLNDEFNTLAESATYVVEPMDAWRKVKGRNRLKGRQLAVLQEVAAWREKLAKERDRPRRWIIKDDLLVDLAKRMPEDLTNLASNRGYDSRFLEQHGSTLLKLVSNGQQLDKAQWPKEKSPPPQLSVNQQAQVDLLAGVLRLLAQQHDINAAAVASRKDLERLVAGETDILLLQGWRKNLAGETLLDVLQGKQVLTIKDSELSLVRISD